MTAPAKGKVQTLKLEPGTDLVGTVKFVSFYPEKEKDGETYGAQWGLTGTWNGQEGRVYIDLRKLTNDLQSFIKEDGKWGDGSPKYKWTDTRVFRLHPYVKDKKHYVTVMPDGEKNGSPPIQQAEESEEAEAKAEANDKLVRKRWSDMQEVYEACVKIALKAWTPNPPVTLHPDHVVAAAATLFIEANKRNLPPPPKREAQQ